MRILWLAVLVGLLCALLALSLRSTCGASATGDAREPDPQPAHSRPEATRTWALRAVRIAGVLGGVYVAAVLAVLLFESRLVYYPTRQPALDWQPPEGVEECIIQTSDALRLYAWWQPAAQGGQAPVLLWFHGNAGNVTHRAENLQMFQGTGLSVLLLDYRGYGKSQGCPSEPGIYLDGEAAYRYLVEEQGVDPRRIVCFGRSLGSAVALHVALQCPVAGLVLESPLASARAMARRMMPLVPVWPFIRSRFDNVGRVSDIRVPLLVIHGDCDEVVPLRQARAVFAAAPEPKELYVIASAGHNDTYIAGGEAYLGKLVGFCRQCAARVP